MPLGMGTLGVTMSETMSSTSSEDSEDSDKSSVDVGSVHNQRHAERIKVLEDEIANSLRQRNGKGTHNQGPQET